MKASNGSVIRAYNLVPDISTSMEAELRTFIRNLRQTQQTAESIRCTAAARLGVAESIGAQVDALEVLIDDHGAAWRELRRN